ncbi:MAG TPA: hypothetical protein VMX14_06235 [Anaerolineae bacterium]|nr:hypothetical protein [Anaerolineae bacterium]
MNRRGLLLAIGLTLAVIAVAAVALVSRKAWQAREAWSPASPVLPFPSRLPSQSPTQDHPLPPAARESAPPVYPLATTRSPTPGASPPQERLYFPSISSAHPTATSVPVALATPRPKPTPTPTLPWPAPLAAPGRSKLGIHVQWNCSHDIMEFIRLMKPILVKSAGDLGFLAETKEASPSTVTMARFTGHEQRQAGDPIQAARAFVNAHLEEYLKHPAVDYWEGYNEPDVRGRMAWYAAFEVERVRLMAQHGLRAAVGGFSTGVPEWEDFEAFLPAIEAVREHGGILTLHEYDAPVMDRSVGAGLPGRPGSPDRGALALRYRWWYEDFLKPRGLVVPLVISEAGIDGGIPNRPGPAGKGWQDFVGYWSEVGLGDDGIQTYLQQLAWYDEQLRQDDYVIGFAVFTAGAMNDDWRSFDITSILRHIATYILVPAA